MHEEIISREEEKEETDLIIECFTGIPSSEDVERLNEIQKRKLERALRKFGKVYVVNINLCKDYEETSKPIVEIKSLDRVFANWDAIIPPTADKKELEKLWDLIVDYNKNPSTKKLDPIFEMIEKLGGVTLSFY